MYIKSGLQIGRLQHHMKDFFSYLDLHLPKIYLSSFIFRLERIFFYPANPVFYSGQILWESVLKPTSESELRPTFGSEVRQTPL